MTIDPAPVATRMPVGTRVRIQHLKPWKRSLEMSGVVGGWRDGMLVIERTFVAGGRYDSLGDLKVAGDHGIIEVVPGGWVMRRVYFRADGRLIGELYNIQTPTEIAPGLVRYTDLEVDVVRHGDGRVQIVDVEDLDNAVALGGISHALAETAMDIANELAETLRNGGDWRAASSRALPRSV